jgi:hypothetical protein
MYADWIQLSQERETWWAFMNTTMNFLVSKKAVNFLPAEQLLASQEGSAP